MRYTDPPSNLSAASFTHYPVHDKNANIIGPLDCELEYRRRANKESNEQYRDNSWHCNRRNVKNESLSFRDVSVEKLHVDKKGKNGSEQKQKPHN